ncbi:MAG: ParB/Srx family N-terminal domain-containing protein [Steroidobacteraceae bacterium]
MTQKNRLHPLEGAVAKAAPTQVEMRPVEALIPYARNARTHSDEQVANLAALIREFGWTNPILVDGENGIIAGHGRLAAARKLGLAEVPVIELSHFTESQKKAYILADNKSALNAGWDLPMLREEIHELDAQNFDLALTAFTDKELEDLMVDAPSDHDGEKVDGSVQEQWHVLVECDGERQQRELLERLTAEGYACKALVA